MCKAEAVFLDGWGVVSVIGPDAMRLLEGQLTCHVATMSSAECRLMAICNVKGRVIVSGYVLRLGGVYYLLVSADLLSVVLDVLQKYAVFFQVSLAIVEWALVGIVLDKDDAEFDKLPIQVPAQEGDALSVRQGWVCRLGEVGNAQERTRLIWAVDEWAQLSVLKKSGMLQNNVKAHCVWKQRDVMQGMVFVSKDISQKWTPEDLNYIALGVVSLKKGCYIGQEIIARMHYLGKSKNAIIRFRCDASFALSVDLSLSLEEGSQSVGRILSFVCLGTFADVESVDLGCESNVSEQSESICYQGLAIVNRARVLSDTQTPSRLHFVVECNQRVCGVCFTEYAIT